MNSICRPDTYVDTYEGSQLFITPPFSTYSVAFVPYVHFIILFFQFSKLRLEISSVQFSAVRTSVLPWTLPPHLLLSCLLDGVCGVYYSQDQSLCTCHARMHARLPVLTHLTLPRFRYCDGGSWTGDAAAPVETPLGKVYYRGRRLLDAMLDSVLAAGLSTATELLYAGCSAGALTT